MTLVFFLIFERCKGEESLWHPYFEVLDLNGIPPMWADDDLSKFTDKELIASVKYFKGELDKEWEILKAIIKVYTPDLFPEEKKAYEDRSLFNWAANLVSSRAFGYDVPYLCILPMLDMFNHNDDAPAYFDLFHTKLHLAENKIYMHKHTFNIKDDEVEVGYEQENQRLDYNMSAFYQYADVSDPSIGYLINGKEPPAPTYSFAQVFNRFTLHYAFENSGASLKLKEKLGEHSEA